MEKENSFLGKLISYGRGRQTAEVEVRGLDPRGGVTRKGEPRRVSWTVHVELKDSTWTDQKGNTYLF